MSISKENMQKMIETYEGRDVVVPVDLDGETVEITVHPQISMGDFASAAKDMADIRFVDDGDGGMLYAPYLDEFARRFVIVSYFTDIDLGELYDVEARTTVSVVEPVWKFLWSHVYTQIENSVDDNMLYELLCAADKMVDAKRREVEPGPDRLWARLDKLADETKAAMGEMSPEDGAAMRAVIEKLNGLDEGKIVELMR